MLRNVETRPRGPPALPPPVPATSWSAHSRWLARIAPSSQSSDAPTASGQKTPAAAAAAAAVAPEPEAEPENASRPPSWPSWPPWPSWLADAATRARRAARPKKETPVATTAGPTLCEGLGLGLGEGFGGLGEEGREGRGRKGRGRGLASSLSTLLLASALMLATALLN